MRPPETDDAPRADEAGTFHEAVAAASPAGTIERVAPRAPGDGALAAGASRPPAIAGGVPAHGGSGPGERLRSALSWRALARWEVVLVAFVAGTLLFGALESPNFLTGTGVFDFGLNIGTEAIMAVPLTLVVITGEIDLSVASTLGLANAVLGYLFAHGWPIVGAMALVGVIGIVCGAFNGVLVTRLGLPSLAVTIGTLTLYRGIATIVLNTNTVTGFPARYTSIGTSPVGPTNLSFTLVVFLVMAVVFGVVLHATPLGRRIYAIGLQQETAFFSGIRVKRIKLALFTLSGFVCAMVGILWTFQFATAASDSGLGLELVVVTIVLFGGVSIFGGRGTMIGVVMAVVVLGGLENALSLINVSAEVQNVVTGCLLLVSVTLPNGIGWLARRGERVHRPEDPVGEPRPTV